MDVQQTPEVQLPDDRPPDWANSLMRWACTAPGIQKMVGQGVALITFEGRRTAKQYTIPVSYHREGNTVTIITKRQRRWWHNFETPLDVELRLAGKTYAGKAHIATDDAENLEFMNEYLQKRPIDAKAYGLDKDHVTKEKIARIIPHIVVIRIEIAPADVPSVWLPSQDSLTGRRD